LICDGEEGHKDSLNGREDARNGKLLVKGGRTNCLVDKVEDTVGVRALDIEERMG
jgi:hypothetical protein